MSIESVPGLIVRPGSDADQPLVDEVCAEIWGGEDYVPYMWKHWGKDSNNQRYILELEGQPVGLYCLRLGIATPTSAWIQGVRVAPALRKRGIAGGLLEHAMAASRTQEMTELRYTTALDNTPMHRLAERYGFHYVSTYLIQDYAKNAINNEVKSEKQATATSADTKPRAVQPEELEAAWNLITHSPEYLTARQFYCYNWLWMVFTRERLAQHLAAQEFYTFDEPENLRGLVLRASFAESTLENLQQPVYRVAGLYGEPAERVRLLNALAQEITALTPPNMQVAYDCQLAQTPETEWALKEAGFVPNHHEPVMFMYEKVL